MVVNGQDNHYGHPLTLNDTHKQPPANAKEYHKVVLFYPLRASTFALGLLHQIH